MNDKGFGNSDSLQVKIAREIREKQANTLAVGVHGLIYVDESKRFRKHLETNHKGIRYNILGSELISRRTAAKDKCRCM